MRILSSIVLISSFALQLNAQGSNREGGNVKWDDHKILVYTKNGKGYVHENIPFSVKCVEKLAQQNGFKVEVSDNPTLFTEENLKQYSVLVFASTNNDVFDTDDQRLAFRRYIEAGGGFVGIHSVVGTERNWTWFKMMLGGTFAWHPKFQKYTIQVIHEHASVSGLPKTWVKEDECYFQKEMYPGIRPVMAHDITTLDQAEKEKITTAAGPYTKYYPAVWHQKFDGGTIWITALGHDKKDYEDPTFVQHIFQGLKFVASQVKSKEYAKAYAKDRNEPVQY
jgi:type 1 glutamine amidotransferase